MKKTTMQSLAKYSNGFAKSSVILLMLVSVWKMRSISTVSMCQVSVAQCRTPLVGTMTSSTSVLQTLATSVLRSLTAAGGTTSASMPTLMESTIG